GPPRGRRRPPAQPLRRGRPRRRARAAHPADSPIGPPRRADGRAAPLPAAPRRSSPRNPSRPDGPPPSRPRAPRLRPRPVVAGLPCPTPSLVLRFDPCTSAERESKEAQTSLLLELRGSPELLTPI